MIKNHWSLGEGRGAVKEYDEKEYGMINIGKQIKDLNVLVLEVNPIEKYPQDFDIIKKYLSKWFNEMGIKEQKYKILKTAYPVSTKPIINAFLSKWK